MAKLPEKSSLHKINLLVEENLPRPHLGGSVIGHECRRYLVYSFRWAYKNKIESKLNRIFRIGDAVEDLIIKDLRRIGINVESHTADGKQIKVSGFMGHAGGSVDGVLSSVPEYPKLNLLFEAKSANHTNFLDIVRKGVKVSKPIYYRQTQIYMGKLELTVCMFVVLDKNTSELYIEFIEFDPAEYGHLLEVEEDVITAESIMQYPRISTNPSWFTCKFCAANEICHRGGDIQRNCRTCKWVVLAEGGRWSCDNSKAYLCNETLTVKEQEAGCLGWELDKCFKEEEANG